MKTVLHSIALVIIVSIIASCSHQNSITKRRYMKGYHINHNTPREGLASNKNQVKKPELNKSEESLPLIKKEDIKQEEFPKDGLIAENNVPTKNSPTKAFSHLSNISKMPFGIVGVPKISSPEKLFNSLSKDKTYAAQPDPVRATLSLLWILILALLIVYIIGLLADGFGLGWVIHILAVVVVVLLILWLLRLL